jgi:hypothetical protein
VCGAEDIPEYDADQHEEYETPEHGCWDYACEECRRVFDSSESFREEEPIAWVYSEEGYKAHSDSDGDIWVEMSPYVTRAALCSPCAPGAAYLTSDTPEGDLAYCFGHDWFEGGRAPYPVYDAVTLEPIPGAPPRMRCECCSPSVVNGVFCHESGCPNERKVWNPEEGDWESPESPEESDWEEESPEERIAWFCTPEGSQSPEGEL